ncbi:MAG: FKBP12-associated protein [Peltula sp. TS41687]|nr:MAG: FKBP12-associated protein [Peltula sp. TS41687]
MERQSSKRKQRPLDAGPLPPDDGVEVEHICTRTCGRKLKCGNHICPELCHKGPCGSCREAIFDELLCHCGRTVLQPPLPCGTKPPPCRYNCERPKLCEHPQVAHNCHGNDEDCPKCPFLTEKLCVCGKKTLKNQPCWRTDVSCGEICGKLLRCGSHNCRNTCHGPGDCEDAGKSCRQMCGKPKKACQHPCEEQCHAPYACRGDKPCQRKILVTCACQHVKKEMRCNASKSSEGNQTETLSCDDECARLERNHKLALALNIDPETHKDEYIPYSKETLDLYANNTKWAQTQERVFRVFAANESEKRIRFKPMPGHQRGFLHALAEDFGFDSESIDPEPHRHVVVFKTPRFVMAPMKTLAQCVELRTSKQATIPATDPHPPARPNSTSPDPPFNAFLLLELRFALTQEELHSHIDSLLSSSSSNQQHKLTFDTHFLPSENIILQARPASNSKLNEHSLSSTLSSLKPSLRHLLRSRSLASAVLLCRVDSALHILYQEQPSEGTTAAGGGGGVGGGGWSTVAAKAAAPRTMVKEKGPMGEKSVFTVLGSRVREKEKERKKEKKMAVDVADDWEKAEEEEELKEQAVVEGVAQEGEGRRGSVVEWNAEDDLVGEFSLGGDASS